MKRFVMAAAAALCLAAAVSPAQAMVVGAADTSNSYPFGSTGGGPYYQQIYSATNFAAPITISQLSFYNTLSPATATPLSDTFTLFLSTSAAAVGTFDTANMAFPDGTFTQVFNGKVSLVNGRLDIALTTPFIYNPATGNLLLTVRDFDFGSGGSLFLDADQNTGKTNMRISAFGYDFNQGLVTGFNDLAGAVPEPSTWVSLITGFGLIGGALRRRRVSGAAVA